MKTDDEATEAPDTEAPAPPKAKAKRKAAVKAADSANGKAPVKAKAKRKAAAKPAKGAVKAKGKKVERQRDPAKLDAFGFRKGSIKSKAAAMYAKGKGATLAEVKEEVGSIQFNLLTELIERGVTVNKAEVKNEGGRMVTRYKIAA